MVKNPVRRRRHTIVWLVFLIALPLSGVARLQNAPSGAASAIDDVDKARSLLEGTFELDEWHVGGKALRPPDVEGRFSIHDGVILFMTTRKDGGTIESTHGWGHYRIERTGWTYGYHHLEAVQGPAAGPFTRTVRPPSSSLLKLHWEGPKLIVEGQGSDHREYTRDSFISNLSPAGDFRKWRRIQ